MINPITNLAVFSSVAVSNISSTVTFSFTQHTDPLIGGYYLYKSKDNVTFTMCKFRIDNRVTNSEEDSTTSNNGLTYFEYTTQLADAGCQLYFHIIAVSKIKELSVASSVVSCYISLTSVTNVIASYNSKLVTISWTGISTINNINSSFSHYQVVKRRVEETPEPVIFLDNDTEENFIFDSTYKVGKYGLVKDVFAISTWFYRITTPGRMPVEENSFLSLISDSTTNYAPKEHNLKCYVENDLEIEVGITTNTSYTDVTPGEEGIYIYSVYACGTNNNDSIKVGYPVTISNLSDLVPIIRNVENMNNSFIKSAYWAQMKKVLVGDSFYDKSTFALPFFSNELYSFRGYLGIGNCTINVYLNDYLSTTVITDSYGAFVLNLSLPLGTTSVQIQAINSDNDTLSQLSEKFDISTYNMYTYFAVIGEQFKEIDTVITDIKDSIDLDTCSNAMFELKYSPLIDLYKGYNETEVAFKGLASAILKSFQNVSFEQSLTDLLDGFRDNVTQIEDYRIFYNHSLYQSKRTRYSFVVNTNCVVTRGIYYYGVSAVGSQGEESTPTTIKVDTRYWPYGYAGYLLLTWREVPNAVSYNIYRSNSSENDLLFLTNTSYNFMIDNGMMATTPDNYPMSYNFSGLSKPSNLENFIDLKVCEQKFGFRKGTWIHIIIYNVAAQELPTYQLERLNLYVSKVIPPEIRYAIIVCNNTGTTILE